MRSPRSSSFSSSFLRSRALSSTRPAAKRVQRQLHPSEEPVAGATGTGPGGDGAERPFRFVAQPRAVEIIGAPMTAGQPLLGTDVGPELIRKHGLRSRLASLGWRVSDRGDLAFPAPAANDASIDPAHGHAKNSVAVGRGNKILSDAVADALGGGRFPLVVGGDHSVAFGSLAGVLRHNPDTRVLWVDAHADINTPTISPSGNMHGMPLGKFLGLPGFETGRVPGFEWMDEDGVPGLDPSRLVYVGLRDVDDGEVRALRSLAGVTCFTMSHVDRHGIGPLMEMALEALGGDDHATPIHMSFDIDSVDPLEAPSTGTVVRGGLSYREAHYVCERVAETGRLASMDMVEVNPNLSHGEDADATADLALALTESAMGNRIM